jgi:hypothetical protein
MKKWFFNYAPFLIAIGTLLTALINTLNGNGDIASGYYLAFSGWLALFTERETPKQ